MDNKDEEQAEESARRSFEELFSINNQPSATEKLFQNLNKEDEEESKGLPVMSESGLKKPVFIIQKNKPAIPLHREQSNQSLAIQTSHQKANPTKNIIKNYGYAIANYAVSKLAIPYIEGTLRENEVSLKDFQKYIKEKRDELSNIKNFRILLVEEERDTAQERKFKKVFKEAAISFMKYFSVNWIFSSKIKYKKEHLKYRGKLLRRIRNPELFTNLK
jgi:hypothetical protein